jgi:hypothetical protein
VEGREEKIAQHIYIFRCIFDPLLKKCIFIFKCPFLRNRYLCEHILSSFVFPFQIRAQIRIINK